MWTPHKARVAADFGAAAGAYDQAARLQKAVLSLLFERLPAALAAPGTIMDLGCGTGLALPTLASRFPASRLLALDLAEGMIRHARARQVDGAKADAWVVGDAEALPLAAASLDLVFSSLAIQWCENSAELFGELGRVTAPDGGLLVSTLVEGTLEELRRAWYSVDPGRPHVNRFLPVARLRDEVHRCFPQAQIEVIPIRLLYPDLMALLRELKSLGARYKDGGSRSVATAPGRLRRLEGAYGADVNCDAGLPATYQVAIIQV